MQLIVYIVLWVLMPSESAVQRQTGRAGPAGSWSQCNPLHRNIRWQVDCERPRHER